MEEVRKAHPVTWGTARVLVPAMALAMVTVPAWAGAVGGEFQVNTYWPNNQSAPSVGSREILIESVSDFHIHDTKVLSARTRKEVGSLAP